MTNATENTAANTTTAAAATQGAQAAPTKATSTRKASQKKAAPKAKGARKTAASKQAKPAAKKTSKPATTKASVPRESSKRAVIIEMLHAKGGASLDEIVTKTSWQRHTVRGLLSTLRSKSGLAIERFDRDGGGHAYRITRK